MTWFLVPVDKALKRSNFVRNVWPHSRLCGVIVKNYIIPREWVFELLMNLVQVQPVGLALQRSGFVSIVWADTLWYHTEKLHNSK